MVDVNKNMLLAEKSKLLTRISILVGIGSLVLGGVVVVTGVTSERVGLDVYALSLIPFALTFLFSCAAAVFASFAGGMASENQEKELLRKRKDRSAFDTDEDARFTAKRSFANYKRYAPYALAALAALIVGGALVLFQHYWSTRVETPTPANPLQAAFLAAVLMFVSVFTGAFCVGQSRERVFRWLRPVGAWMAVGFIVNLLAAIAALGSHFGSTSADYYLSRIVFWLLAVLAVELIVNFITEFYRPRMKRLERPVFESRLLALFTEPGGVARNIADTLDYQFGFKVSKTWIYASLERSLAPLVVAWLCVLWLSTIVVEVGPEAVGVRERFGEVIGDEPLGSGIHLKIPWPFGRIAKYPIHRVHEIVVGPEMKKDGKEIRPEVVLWTKSHYAKESRYLVAARKEHDGDEVPVSFLSASFPIQYRVRRNGVLDFAYAYRDGEDVLKTVAERVVTRYLASVDFINVMSVDRAKTTEELRREIQAEVDRMRLGVDVVSVNFHDSHPPVEEVAPAFQAVVGARQEKEAKILEAKAYAKSTNQQTESKARELILQAEAHRGGAIKIAEAERERFDKQYGAYKEMPGMFKLRMYLDLLENETENVRMYIMSNTMRSEIYEINLEEKTQFDLIDADLTELDK